MFRELQISSLTNRYRGAAGGSVQCPGRKALLLVALTSLCLVCPAAWAETGVLVVHIKDVQQNPVAGLQIGVEVDGGSATTDSNGEARIKLAPQTKEKSWVSLQIVKSPPGKDLVMVSPWEHRTLVPSFENESGNFVEVMVVQRGDHAALQSGTVLKAAVSQIIKANSLKSADKQAGPQEPNTNLEAIARQFGLNPEDLDKAIKAWGAKTTDPYEAGLAALYARNDDKATVDLQASLKQQELKLAADPGAVADAAFFLGESLQQQGKYADAAFILGQSLQQQGKYKESAEAYERSLSLFRASNNREGEALVLLNLAQLNSALNKPEAFEKAISYFTEAVPWFQAVSDRFKEAMCWWGLGTANDRLGRTQQARDAYLKALPFFTENKNGRVLGRIWLDLGEDEDALGNVQKAVEYYEQALPLLASQGEGLRQWLALARLGKARQKLKDPAKAMDAYKAAIAVGHSTGDKAAEASAYLMLGDLLFEKHDWKGALDADAAAFKLSEETGDRSGQASALIGWEKIQAEVRDSLTRNSSIQIRWVDVA